MDSEQSIVAEMCLSGGYEIQDGKFCPVITLNMGKPFNRIKKITSKRQFATRNECLAFVEKKVKKLENFIEEIGIGKKFHERRFDLAEA